MIKVYYIDNVNLRSSILTIHPLNLFTLKLAGQKG